MNTIHHPENDHWAEWRTAVLRVGYCAELAKAAMILEAMETMTVEEQLGMFKSEEPCKPCN